MCAAVQMYIVYNYVGEAVYHYIAALRGDTVVLRCNTSQYPDAVNWTLRPTNENHSYVYSDGRLEGRPGTDGRYSVVTLSRNEHSLRIYNVHPRLDTGQYDCYESSGVRRFGYQLNVTGVWFLSCQTVPFITVRTLHSLKQYARMTLVNPTVKHNSLIR